MNKQICKNCVYFSVYYKKHISSFSRTDCGYCDKHNRQQSLCEFCGEFKSNQKKREKEGENLLLYLRQSAAHLNQIVQILSERE